MCLCIYPADLSPMVIRYHDERIEFADKNNDSHFVSIHRLLIHNPETNVQAFSELNILAARPLFKNETPKGDDGDEYNFTIGIQDITEHLVDLQMGVSQRMSTEGRDENRRATLSCPDPNRPWVSWDPPLSGRWPTPFDTMYSNPNLDYDLFRLFDKARITATRLVLPTPLTPGDSQWLCMRVNVDQAGTPDRKKKPYRTHHEFASSIDVFRTVYESLVASYMVAQFNVTPIDITELYLDTLQTFFAGMNQQRVPDFPTITHYYELSLYPGKEGNRHLISWTTERDLQMRSHSPKTLHAAGEELFGFEWKTGSMLEPRNRPWANEGYRLHVVFQNE